MTAKLPCDSVIVKTTGERSAGNLHAAFDEEGKPWPLLYRLCVRIRIKNFSRRGAEKN